MKEEPKSESVTGGGQMEAPERLIATRFQYRQDFTAMSLEALTFERLVSPFYEGERWAVRHLGSCLNRRGQWESEPIPSSRNDKFYARCRFPSLESAIETYERKFSK